MKHKALFTGLTTVDIQYFVGDYPKPNTKIKTETPVVLTGGPATNAAVLFSFLNDGAYLCSAIGRNPFTEFITTDFKQLKIDLFDIVSETQYDPILATIVTDKNGDRTIFSHNPGKLKIRFDLNRLIKRVNPEIVLVDGFYPEHSIELAKICKMNSIPVVADCGSWKPQYEEMLKYVDFIICSADFFPPDCSDEELVFDYLQQQDIKHIAISRGDKSILFLEQQHKGEVKIKKTEVIDTLGAGDFLHGAFCYYYLQTQDFKRSLIKASEIATLSCSYKGTREWLKSRELALFLKNNT